MVFAARLLSTKAVQAYPYIGNKVGHGPAPTVSYTITKEDLPESLMNILFDVGQGNPKNVLELIDPLLSGYNKPAEYIRQSTLNGGEDWCKPVVKISGNHQICVLDDPSTGQPYDLDRFPWPVKVVQFVEQQFQELEDKKQYILRVASIFKHGFSTELLRPFIENFREFDLKELVEAGFLNKFGEEWFSEGQWRQIHEMDPTVSTAFCFTSTLLQRVIGRRIVQREKEHLMCVEEKARIRCKWMMLWKGWQAMRDAKQLLISHDFDVTLKRDKAPAPVVAACEKCASAAAVEVPDAVATTNAAPSVGFIITYMLIGALLAVLAMRFTSADAFIEGLGQTAGLW